MRFLIVALLALFTNTLSAQVGYGFTLTNDLYHRYANPSDGIASRSAGSAILNLGAGPKYGWGTKHVFISGSPGMYWFLGLAVKDYKGSWYCKLSHHGQTQF